MKQELTAEIAADWFEDQYPPLERAAVVIGLVGDVITKRREAEKEARELEADDIKAEALAWLRITNMDYRGGATLMGLDLDTLEEWAEQAGIGTKEYYEKFLESIK